MAYEALLRPSRLRRRAVSSAPPPRPRSRIDDGSGTRVTVMRCARRPERRHPQSFFAGGFFEGRPTTRCGLYAAGATVSLERRRAMRRNPHSIPAAIPQQGFRGRSALKRRAKSSRRDSFSPPRSCLVSLGGMAHSVSRGQKSAPRRTRFKAQRTYRIYLAIFANRPLMMSGESLAVGRRYC
jgi:hypothetical protein